MEGSYEMAVLDEATGEWASSVEVRIGEFALVKADGDAGGGGGAV